MQPPDANPYHAPVQVISTTSRRPRHLNLTGRLLLALIFVAGVALFTYGGFLLGTIVGLERGAPHLTAPPAKDIGLAPDLSGLVNGTAEFVVSVLIATIGGLLAGAIVMSLACLLIRTFAIRSVAWLSTGDQPNFR
jgi:hypothetical protein